jgi:hypothetical protein
VKRVNVMLSQPAMSMKDAETIPLRKNFESISMARDEPERPSSRHEPCRMKRSS